MEPGGPDDDRAVSTLIGVVFLLGTLVIMLSVYQAVIVPQQNKKVEFDHSMAVQDDMLDLRNAILEADSTGKRTFAEVKLGTDYPPRLVTRNPPAATGALRTSQPGTIDISDGAGNPITDICPGSAPIETRYLTYRIDYNQYQTPPKVVYENSVLYLNFSGNDVLLTNETLVSGDTFSISPVDSDFDETGVGATSVEPIPGLVKDREITGATIEFPSQLSAAQWEKLLAEDMANIQSITKANGKITITAEAAAEISVSCSPVGLNAPPEGGERGGGSIDINPVEANDVQLIDISLDSNKRVITATLRNNNVDKDAKIARVRLAFFHTPDGIDEMTITELGNATSPTLTMQLLGEFQFADPDYEIPADTTAGDENVKQFELRVYDRSDNQGQVNFDKNQDWFTLQVVFDNGISTTYFIAAEDFGIQ